MWRPELEKSEPSEAGFGWGDLFDEYWDDVEVDLCERFRIDIWDPRVLDRPWPWLVERIMALLSVPEIYTTIVTDEGFATRAFPATRIQRSLSKR